jgi:hypothetical protein
VRKKRGKRKKEGKREGKTENLSSLGGGEENTFYREHML